MNRGKQERMMQTQPALVLGDKVWCPRCGEYVKVVRVTGAARIIDVDRRTVYNYIKKNKIFSVRVPGGTMRVCSHCLLRENHDLSAANAAA
jgi:hydrogenase maturation factor HypF (carbamoyltransferase family)